MDNDCNIGIFNEGKYNTGNRNEGDFNTGDSNVGKRNTGSLNIGDLNTGRSNIGYRNTNDCNVGYMNTGFGNVGNFNTGNWNTANNCSGHFCTKTPAYFMFNKECTRDDFFKQKPLWLYFNIIEVEHDLDYGRCVKKYEYKEAARISWNKAEDNEKLDTINLPNFDPDIFLEIFGIDLKKEVFNGNKYFETIKEDR